MTRTPNTQAHTTGAGRTTSLATRSRGYAVSLAALTALTLTGCSLAGGQEESSGGENAAEASSSDGGEVVLVTHDSFNLPEEVLSGFTEETGYELTVLPSGDAGEMTNTVALTQGSPLGDAVFGIDNTFASRAVDEGVLVPYTPSDPPKGVQDRALPGELADYLTPVDFGDVCVNIDRTWFEREGVAEPSSLADLTDPEYKGLFVTPGASTSSPGMAFMLATIAEFGEQGWQQYWSDLVDNDVRVVGGWEDAYTVDFTAGGGDGDRPIVVSYASSPPFTIGDDGVPTTKALMDTCFGQVEYAGVLEGAANEKGAQAAVDYLLSDAVQEALPESMYVFPVVQDTTLPTEWDTYAEVAQDPLELPAEQIEANRKEWVSQWADIATG
ncbi:MAG: thiamine ABC transporter substrate-binding protein [Ornithinimicrobium sp.]